MNNEIYESIIRNSKIAYLKINCKTNNHNKYIDIEVLEQNNEFENVFKILTENNVFDKDVTELIINNWIKKKFKQDQFDKIVRDAIKNGYVKNEYNTELNDKNVTTEMYYLKDYFILIFSINYNISCEDKNFKIYNWSKDLNGVYLDAYYNYQNDSEIYVKKAIIGKKDLDLWDESEVYEFRQQENSVIADMDAKTFYRRLTKSDGSNIYLESTIWPLLDNNKNIIGTRGFSIKINDNITEKIKIDEGKNQLKLDFFANLSHELRTPINLISSTIQLIKLNLTKLSSEDADKFYKYMYIMEMNSLRLVRLINNLLDSTRIDAGFINFNPINADIVGFVEDICDSIVDFTKSNNMNLIFDPDIEEELILFDPDIIERTMLNLLSNAIKFNRQNGNIYVNLYSTDDEIIVSVKDEGVGIPQEKVNLIFERFEQVQSRNKIEKQGSGIGLYLVNSLIVLHGGKIKVNSKVNEGSEFIVSIPKKVGKNTEEFMLTNEEVRYNRINIEFSDI